MNYCTRGIVGSLYYAKATHVRQIKTPVCMHDVLHRLCGEEGGTMPGSSRHHAPPCASHSACTRVLSFKGRELSQDREPLVKEALHPRPPWRTGVGGRHGPGGQEEQPPPSQAQGRPPAAPPPADSSPDTRRSRLSRSQGLHPKVTSLKRPVDLTWACPHYCPKGTLRRVPRAYINGARSGD